jgi:putative colanic acid biosynthesis UDP-glucose lipid carrier transferase
LQRRKSITTTFQAMIDGLIVLLTIYIALKNDQGFFSILDAIFMLTLLTLMGITYDRMGIYRRFEGPAKSVKKLVYGWSISFAITLFIFVMAQYFDQLSSRAMLIIYFVALTGQLANRWVLMNLQTQTSSSQEAAQRVLLIGGGTLVKHLYDNINNNPWINEKAIGRIKISSYSEEITVPVLGERENLIDVVRENHVTAVYIAVSLENSDLVKDIYLDLVNENIDIHWIPNVFSLDLINHSVKEIAGLPLLTLSESPLIGNYRLFKEIEDRIMAVVALVALCPLLVITALLIKIDSPGPVIFRQQRTGWNGKNFHIYKFRSMQIHNTEDGQLKQASADDERFTRVGRFIRKTSIDELPQLFNVLRGEMSMVGPRPHAIEHNSEYAKRINTYMTRHRIKPGITGLAQVNGFRGETDTLEKMKSRVEYDMQYINNWSFWLDIKILLKTLPALIRGEAY